MMRRWLALVVCAGTIVWWPGTRAAAWGFDVHRFITERAIGQLPDDIRPFYEKHRAFVVEHSIDPDLWRSAGFTEEPPRHFVDLDAYGPFPFTALPRDHDEAVAKFGREKVDENGTLPWRVAEIHAELVKSFTQHRDGTSPWALDSVRFFSAALAHYVADAHVPFHAILNYDGQLTNQHGLHSRFETELFLRYRDRLRLDPPRIAPIGAPRDFVFDTLLSGFTLSEGLLKADAAAIGDGDTYDDAYFDRFFARAQPVLEQRLSQAVAAVAAAIAGAWEAAGRPSLPLETPRTVRKKRPAGSRP
jgi:hypothetical protein